MHVQSQITILRPAEEVFAVLTDAPTITRWASTTDRAWWVTPPPYGVGSVRRATGMVRGQRFENEATIVEHDPPRRQVLSGEESGARFRVAVDLAPVPEGTTVTVTSDIELTGGMRLFGPMISREYRKTWDADLASLKRMMEAGELP